MMRKREEPIPVYLFTGFMDSGKTSLINETLKENDFGLNTKLLLILCEDGEVEYDEIELKKKHNANLIRLENESDFTNDYLRRADKNFSPDLILIEYNGPWKTNFIEEENINRVCFYHLVYSGRGTQMMDEDVLPQQSREAMDIIIKRTLDFEARGLKKEILTVDNHCDGVYMYLKAKAEGNEALAEQIKKYTFYNGGNRSGIAFGEVDPMGYVHPDQFTQYYTFGNVRDRKFGDIWSDTSNPIMAGLKDRKSLLTGRCSKCKFLDVCNGNFRTRAEARNNSFWAEDPSCYLTDEEMGIK